MLAKDFHIVAVDIHGHGASGYRDPMTLEEMTEDFYRLLEQLNLRKVIWFGCSIGGMIGMRLALAHHEAIDSLILISTTARLDPPEIKEATLQLWELFRAGHREDIAYCGHTPGLESEDDITLESVMRKIIESTLVSLDGVIGDPHLWAMNYFDNEAQDDALELLLASDAMLMGRRTYEIFAGIWPVRTGDYADRMNSIRKYVFSSTLERADWNNSIIFRGGVAAEVAKLKQQDGQDLVIYGHGPLSQTLLERHLLDELRFWIHPLIVGRGKLLFREGEKTILKLVVNKTLRTGVVALIYQLAGKDPEEVASEEE